MLAHVHFVMMLTVHRCRCHVSMVCWAPVAETVYVKLKYDWQFHFSWKLQGSISFPRRTIILPFASSVVSVCSLNLMMGFMQCSRHVVSFEFRDLHRALFWQLQVLFWSKIQWISGLLSLVIRSSCPISALIATLALHRIHNTFCRSQSLIVIATKPCSLLVFWDCCFDFPNVVV